MLLARSEFRNLQKQSRLRIALVGMSNSGKSTLGRQLGKELGFEFFEVDSAINQSLGIHSLEESANWLGHPFEEKYLKNRETYLQLEEQHTRIEFSGTRNFVLDTTGSIIYGSQSLLDWLAQHYLIVGLGVSETLCNLLAETYFQMPKPVIWGSEFDPGPHEEPLQALKRCFPSLLQNRTRLYQRLSDVEIAAELVREGNLDATRILNEIESKLP
ncbi:MAG: shikimate kinase [Planctomycetota bacterium]|nr:shikimate kinase [Planctomycetota bacterium]